MTKTARVIVTLSALVALAPIAFAEPPAPALPPTEAVDACVNRSAGDACTVTLHAQQMRGKCRTFPSGELACLPDAPPPLP